MAYVILLKTRQILALIELPLMPQQAFNWVNIKLADILGDLAGYFFADGFVHI